jgi:hypothetical protein
MIEDRKPVKRDFVQVGCQLYPETLVLKANSEARNQWTLEIDYTAEMPVVISAHLMVKVFTDMLYNVTER